jgi:ribose transport system ATP-binding protein
MLRLHDIGKRFGPTVALDEVNFDLRRGEVHALIGENGAGKSTLMNVLAGALQPDRGRMEIDDQPYAPATPSDARRHRIAFVHQELSLCPHLSVAENILLGMETSQLGWLDRAAMRRRTAEVLAEFGHPEMKPETRVADLPVAARQVVEICRAMAARAEIILMDEPTSSLQREDVRRLFALIGKLRANDISVIYISHFLEEVREIADRFTVLRDGRSVATGEIGAITDEELIAQMVGRPVEALFPQREHRPTDESEILLDVRDLAAPPALKHASFSLRRGEILGVAGLMGSGRTEMVRALFGLDRAEAGAFQWRGSSQQIKQAAAREGSPADRLSQGLGYLSEDRKGEGLALSLSIADNMTVTRFASCSRGGWLNLAQQRAQADELLARIGVKARNAAQITSTLSGGNQQKVAIARLLHQNADVLLLDEPTRGIDIGSKAQVYETIARCADAGKGVLMVSSYLPELFGMCDRLAVMSRGRLGAARPIDEWTPERVMQAAIGKEEPRERGGDL